MRDRFEIDDVRAHIDYTIRQCNSRCKAIKPLMLGRQKYIRDKLKNIRLQVQELMNELRQPKPSEEEIEKLKAIAEV